MKEQSLAAAKALLPDNNMLVIENPFSSLVGLGNEDVTGVPDTSKPAIATQIVDLHHNDQITVENQMATKFRVDHSEAEENASDNGEDIVHTTIKPRRSSQGVGKSKKNC